MYVHFDVDVTDRGEFSFRNYPRYAGVDAEKAIAALEEALAWEKLGGLTMTGINPNNDSTDKMVGRVVQSIAAGMERRITRQCLALVPVCT